MSDICTSVCRPQQECCQPSLNIAPLQAKIAKETNLTEEKLAKVDALKPIAKSLDCTLPQLCLAWVLKNPNVSSVLLGGTKHEQASVSSVCADSCEGLAWQPIHACCTCKSSDKRQPRH